AGDAGALLGYRVSGPALPLGLELSGPRLELRGVGPAGALAVAENERGAEHDGVADHGGQRRMVAGDDEDEHQRGRRDHADPDRVATISERTHGVQGDED